jgi:hypothetical protein
MNTQEIALLRSQAGNQLAMAKCTGLHLRAGQVSQKSQFQAGMIGQLPIHRSQLQCSIVPLDIPRNLTRQAASAMQRFVQCHRLPAKIGSQTSVAVAQGFDIARRELG